MGAMPRLATADPPRAERARSVSPTPAAPRVSAEPAHPDRDLVTALRAGDRAAFESLVRRHGDYLYRVALRVAGSEPEARDAVQEAFVSALRAIGDFDGRAALRTWLYRLTVNAALMRLRARRRRREVSIDELVPEVEGVRDEPDWAFVETVESIAAREQTRVAVQACIDRLPDNYRVVLVLRDIEGHDTREVAALLGESETNVKVRLHRARAAMKKLLEPLLGGGARCE